MCAGVGVFVVEGREDEKGEYWRRESGAKPFRNSFLVLAPLMQGQATKISLQSSLFVAI